MAKGELEDRVTLRHYHCHRHLGLPLASYEEAPVKSTVKSSTYFLLLTLASSAADLLVLTAVS